MTKVPSTPPLADRYRWLPFVLPFVVFMAGGIIEPKPQAGAGAEYGQTDAEAGRGQPATSVSRFSVPYRYYPLCYALRIALTVVAILLFLPVYRTFPPRVTVLALIVGVVGAVVWIGLCRLGWETAFLRPLGLDGLLMSGMRPGYDPFTALGDSPVYLAAFLLVRFFGLVFIVALIEEFFLRGFLMRYFADPDWWTVPVGQATPAAFAVAAIYGVLSHPAEALAAALWFSMVTWLVWKTRSIWDAVAAHATTNLLLGVYILVTRDWSLW